ncbi:NlpC/P60 family protein [Cetobacterium somerae]|uniref:C40 family peptidase n=1 Tax=Cetobacterium sp. NK01 TaxID=2993530 RepID=UPI0021164025|nr:NlpC/P60 family protein [Cetobacterium sp. NK01]MCQ8213032.1 NlpC/P60 family protein [Cetobacterium sp. NK01]
MLVLIFFTGCSSARISERERNERIAKITSFYKEWKGTRYKMGGTSKSGVDCSALMQHLYKEKFALDLPRTTKNLSQEGDKVKKRNYWEVGDLVFFKIGWRKTHHVGVYLGDNRFLHASTSKGVIISEVDGYWDDHFWQVRKIL